MNPWIEHVKAYSKKNKCSYNEALKKAKKTYKKGAGACNSRPTPQQQQPFRHSRSNTIQIPHTDKKIRESIDRNKFERARAVQENRPQVISDINDRIKELENAL